MMVWQDQEELSWLLNPNHWFWEGDHSHHHLWNTSSQPQSLEEQKMTFEALITKAKAETTTWEDTGMEHMVSKMRLLESKTRHLVSKTSFKATVMLLMEPSTKLMEKETPLLESRTKQAAATINWKVSSTKCRALATVSLEQGTLCGVQAQDADSTLLKHLSTLIKCLK